MPSHRVPSVSMRFCRVLAGLLAAGSLLSSEARAQEPPANPFPNAVEVPAGILDGGDGWLNTSAPIDLKQLRGKVVLLDFWTYCCINCMHVLPDLKYLEEKYDKQLVVIGVHSAKFDNEKDSQAIREAIQRYEIQHPVVNDHEMEIWQKFGTRAWPTLALIDPEGKYIGSQSGEGHRELMDEVIGKLVEYHRAKGTLDETPLMFRNEAAAALATPLRYPGKVAVDEAGGRVFVSDSNHNRIVVASFAGELLATIGSGRSGTQDGAFEVAEFNRPQGLVLAGNRLYVADTENHLLRVVDLEARQVSTLAGTGQQGQPGGPDSGRLRDMAINSPWSLAVSRNTLFIAMAGPHQIWSHEMGTDQMGVFAGTGREDVINGPHLAAAFAQPSEIVADAAGEYLYVVDSEGSAIRRLSVDPGGAVETIAGTSELPRGQSLFAFGDVDGIGSEARFQHPLGIAVAGDELFVADSYNHKLRRIDIASRAVTTWLGNGAAGNSLDPVQMSEPGGLALSSRELFVADTNNHRILVTDLATAVTREFVITGLEPPAPPRKRRLSSQDAVIDIVPQRLMVADKLTVQVVLTIPEGYKRNEDFPVVWDVTADGSQSLIAADALDERQEANAINGDTATIELPLSGQPGEATILLSVSYGYCGTEANSVCRLASATWRLPLVVNTEGGAGLITLEVPALHDRRLE